MSALERQPLRRAADPQVAAQPRRLQRKCSCGGASASGETCEDCKRQLQPKLAVGAVDDPLEHEADRVADRVLASSAPSAMGAAPVAVQRAGGDAMAAALAAPPSVERALSGGGRPLEPAVRRDMEQRFGHDFFDVRVHDDALAAESAREVSAHAYTSGPHIAFAAGRYAPHRTEGRRLLAHELAHVVQQSQGAPRYVQRGSLKGPTTTPHSCGGWTCAPMGDCKNPDGKNAPTGTPSTAWSLTANVDLDVLTSQDIESMGDVGHAFVEFSESNGDRYTYGHYPNKVQLPTDFKPEVPGCTAHPDRTHRDCVDLRIAYTLTQSEYSAALGFAQAWCIAGQPYHVLTNNCTTFVDRVVGVAGKTLPSARGPVLSGAVQADNPNTLFDAYVSHADSAAWRQRATGDFMGHYDDAGGRSIPFGSFELKTDDKFAVGGKYSYVGASGDVVKGTLDGRMVFDADAATKAITVTVYFDWTEPSGGGKGRWTVDTAGNLKGTWGRGGADVGAGAWDISKKP